MNPKVIVIDGRTYHSVDELPLNIRQRYEQAMRSLDDENDNHIPDMLETIVAGNTLVNSLEIIVDGKDYKGIEDLPPEARLKYEAAMSKLYANRNGIPDFAEGMLNATNQTINVSSSYPSVTPPRSTPLPASPMLTPDTSNGWKLMLTGLFIILLCAVGAAGVWYFFLG